MKPKLTQFSLSCLALLIALPCFLVTANGAQGTKPSPAAASNTSTNDQQEIPKSVFMIPATAKEGRNPFFPYAVQPAQAPITPVQGPATTVLPASSFALKGITSPPKATAIINGRTFEAGEAGEVKLTTGERVLIKCEEIRSDSVVISLPDGKRLELRLRFGL